MNSEWQSFLDGAGALPEDQSGGAGESASTLCNLAADAVLRVTGDDAGSFLQGQFSNDVSALDGGGSQLSSWSTPKGRVLVLFRLVRLAANDYLIKMPLEQLPAVHKRLQMFVLRAKVKIEATDDFVCVGIGGLPGSTPLDGLFAMQPEVVDAIVPALDEPAAVLYRVRGDTPRFELIAPVAFASRVWQQLQAASVVVSAQRWRLQNIDAGIPCVEAATSEAFVLQMLNLQHIDGVSFKKGCYPGQEVVARMQYLGKLKRRMYLAALDSAEVPTLIVPSARWSTPSVQTTGKSGYWRY